MVIRWSLIVRFAHSMVIHYQTIVYLARLKTNECLRMSMNDHFMTTE